MVESLLIACCTIWMFCCDLPVRSHVSLFKFRLVPWISYFSTFCWMALFVGGSRFGNCAQKACRVATKLFFFHVNIWLQNALCWSVSWTILQGVYWLVLNVCSDWITDQLVMEPHTTQLRILHFHGSLHFLNVRHRMHLLFRVFWANISYECKLVTKWISPNGQECFVIHSIMTLGLWFDYHWKEDILTFL